MAQQNRTLEQLEDLLRGVALLILKLPEDGSDSIRFPFGSDFSTGSAPAFDRNENVCFIYDLPAEDEYGSQFHHSYQDDGAPKLTQVIEYTAVHQVNFVCYGPDAFTWARALNAGIMRQDIKEHLYHCHFFLVPGSQRITYAPELINGEWWRRCDMTARFYEYVRQEEKNSVETIETVRITPVTERRG